MAQNHESPEGWFFTRCALLRSMQTKKKRPRTMFHPYGGVPFRGKFKHVLDKLPEPRNQANTHISLFT